MKIQRLNKETKDPYILAYKYFQIISVLNDLNLAEGELQLVAYTAIRGNITEPKIRKEYCSTYATTPATINNIVYRMKKKNPPILLKKDKLIFVNPELTQVDFNQSLGLVITLNLPVKEPELTREEMENQNNSILSVKKYG